MALPCLEALCAVTRLLRSDYGPQTSTRASGNEEAKEAELKGGLGGSSSSSTRELQQQRFPGLSRSLRRAQAAAVEIGRAAASRALLPLYLEERSRGGGPSVASSVRGPAIRAAAAAWALAATAEAAAPRRRGGGGSSRQRSNAKTRGSNKPNATAASAAAELAAATARLLALAASDPLATITADQRDVLLPDEAPRPCARALLWAVRSSGLLRQVAPPQDELRLPPLDPATEEAPFQTPMRRPSGAAAAPLCASGGRDEGTRLPGVLQRGDGDTDPRKAKGKKKDDEAPNGSSSSKKNKKKKKRRGSATASRQLSSTTNPFLRAVFAEAEAQRMLESGGEEGSEDEEPEDRDTYSDLEDFIVCDPEADYNRVLAKRRRV